SLQYEAGEPGVFIAAGHRGVVARALLDIRGGMHVQVEHNSTVHPRAGPRNAPSTSLRAADPVRALPAFRAAESSAAANAVRSAFGLCRGVRRSALGSAHR